MSTVKIRLHTWVKTKNIDKKFKRGIAAREAYVDYDVNTNKVTLKEGSKKCKPYDTGVSRTKDLEYINERKSLYSGLCFETRKDAFKFIEKHKDEIDSFAKANPLFTHWTVMHVLNKFEPKSKLIYGKDIKED